MKLPLDFGIKLFFRLLLPGFLLTLGLLPLLLTMIDLIGLERQHEVAFVVSMIIVGWMIVMADMPIYMLMEGRHGWPVQVKQKFINGETNRLANINRDIDAFYAVDNPDDGLRRKWLEASVKKRSFPLHQTSGERYVEFPTRLGNAIHAYETYSKVMYELEAVFYWPRIWVNLSKDLREEIDTQQAMADSTVYSSFALGVGGLLWVFYSVFLFTQGLVAWLLDKAGKVTSLPPGILSYLPGAGTCLLFAVIFLGLAYGVYRLSIYTNEQFGTLFMAIIDSHVGKVEKEYIDADTIVRMIEDLTRKASTPDKLEDAHMNMLEDLTREPPARNDRLEIVRRYLQYYTVRVPRHKRPVPVPQIQSTLELDNAPETVRDGTASLPSGQPQRDRPSPELLPDTGTPDPIRADDGQ
ncbi:MAG TPA: hypothetical protein VF006_19595 [Longimicrobium sp.]